MVSAKYVGLSSGSTSRSLSDTWRYRTRGEADRTSGEVRSPVCQYAGVKDLQMLFFFPTRQLPHLGGSGPHLGGSGPHLGGRITAPGRKNDRTPEAATPQPGGSITAPRGKPPTRLSCKSWVFSRMQRLPCFSSCSRFCFVLTTGKNCVGKHEPAPEASWRGGRSRG